MTYKMADKTSFADVPGSAPSPESSYEYCKVNKAEANCSGLGGTAARECVCLGEQVAGKNA